MVPALMESEFNPFVLPNLFPIALPRLINLAVVRNVVIALYVPCFNMSAIHGAG